ncbi:hypothetical protein [Mesorhizobium huakuii]|uniref:hypothetical protein n=1 Tax=Mesorhizobium huakuii TaxID=28104 RepID=UPI0038995445
MSVLSAVGHDDTGPIDVVLQPNEPIRAAISPALPNAALALSLLDGPKISPEMSNRTKRRNPVLVARRSRHGGWRRMQADALSTSLFNFFLERTWCPETEETTMPIATKTHISKTTQKQNRIQRKVDPDDQAKPKAKPVGAMQAGARKYPAPPFPKQHHPKPGHEAEIKPAPL